MYGKQCKKKIVRDICFCVLLLGWHQRQKETNTTTSTCLRSVPCLLHASWALQVLQSQNTNETLLVSCTYISRLWPAPVSLFARLISRDQEWKQWRHVLVTCYMLCHERIVTSTNPTHVWRTHGHIIPAHQGHSCILRLGFWIRALGSRLAEWWELGHGWCLEPAEIKHPLFPDGRRTRSRFGNSSLRCMANSARKRLWETYVSVCCFWGDINDKRKQTPQPQPVSEPCLLHASWVLQVLQSKNTNETLPVSCTYISRLWPAPVSLFARLISRDQEWKQWRRVLVTCYMLCHERIVTSTNPTHVWRTHGHIIPL